MLRPWIDKKKLGILGLSANPNKNAISLLSEYNLDEVGWCILENPNAFTLIEKYLKTYTEEDKWKRITENKKWLNWGVLCKNTNPKVISLLEKYWTYLNRNEWYVLSENSGAISLLEKHPDKICFGQLSSNTSPDAVVLWERFLDKLNWQILSENPSALDFLEKYPEKIDWFHLSRNPNAKANYLIEKNLNKMDEHCWAVLSENPNAIPLLEKYPHKIHWIKLSQNTHEKAISLLENYWESYWWLDYFFSVRLFDWAFLSGNPYALSILEKNPTKINWSVFSSNSNEKAIPLMEKNIEKLDWIRVSRIPNSKFISFWERHIEKINWYVMSGNSHAISLLEKHPEKINWWQISINSNIFMDYEEITQRIAPFRDELIRIALHPTRIDKMLAMAGENACLEDIV